MKDRLIIGLVPQLIRIAYLFLSHTIRWTIVGTSPRDYQGEQYIHAFWHARLLMMLRVTIRWHGYMLISEHRDGGFISDTLNLCGVDTVRGSSTRGGARAMLRMLRAVKNEGRHIGITPDGPKGPAERVQKGTIQLAVKSGLPVVPVCYAASRYWRASSWDRFYIPQPFSLGVFVFGEPIAVLPDDDMDGALERVQQGMDAAQARADGFFNS
ncbi:MAG: lysophospholipid acyltransferase family protein [Mariprofundaceae bacterium]|nr:lysophospholipid acyltransferase family protein [Mariprofundaceae bacterium]